MIFNHDLQPKATEGSRKREWLFHAMEEEAAKPQVRNAF
jgi:hypothetical protein